MIEVAKIRVRVQPGASKTEVVGLQDDVLKVKLTSPPVEGRANKELVAILADLLRVRKADITIVAGRTGRDKLVEVAGLDSDEIRRRLIGA